MITCLLAVLASNQFHFIDLAQAQQWFINLALVYTYQPYCGYILCPLSLMKVIIIRALLIWAAVNSLQTGA